MDNKLEGDLVLEVLVEEEPPNGDLEYTPIEESEADIDLEIAELELDIQALRDKKAKMRGL